MVRSYSPGRTSQQPFCWTADRGSSYYTTYTNRRISAVELRREDLDAAALIRYPMRTREDIFYQNAPGTES